MKAQIVEDSLNPVTGDRLTTFLVTYWRAILPEMLTHKMHSFSTSSSRAIPLAKQIQMVQNEITYPVEWGKNQSGMQSAGSLDDERCYTAKGIWDDAAGNAIASAKLLDLLGLHKQVATRILEPFLPVTQVITATEYENFFKLRCHADAQPDIRALAERMRKLYLDNTPRTLGKTELHLPFVSEDERTEHNKVITLMLSAARCARTSYLNHDQSEPDVDKDTKLFHRLIEHGHFSPLSHQGKRIDLVDYNLVDRNFDRWSANFKGFSQYRHWRLRK